MKAQPWLFRRLVALGLVWPTMPIYAFTDPAAEQVALLNGSVPQERLAEVALPPHEEFAVEMTVADQTNTIGRFRTVTVVLSIARQREKFPEIFPRDEWNLEDLGAQFILMEVQAASVGMTVLPQIIMPVFGKYAAFDAGEVGRAALRDMATTHAKLMRAAAMKNRHNKHAAMLQICDPDLLTTQDYNTRAGEAVSFLTTACAVMASPAATQEMSASPLRIKAGKGGRERKVETKWTTVDVDIDREAHSHSEQSEGREGGVALHPVRAHLRLTRYGISPVRAHMRGDPRFGVRHRLGDVHRGGE